jgi:hypothetical protein
MARSTRELDLTEVHRTLNTWRRVAWVTTATGPERYRAVLASDEQRLRPLAEASPSVPSALAWSVWSGQGGGGSGW